MTFDSSAVLSIVSSLIVFAFGYGILNQKVKSIEKKVDEIDDLRDEVRNIGGLLQNLIGKVDTFISLLNNQKGDCK